MLTFIFNFLLGTFGTLMVFLIPLCIKKEAFSAPFFVVAVGMLCGFLSLTFGYASTWSILLLYLVLTVADVARQKSQKKK